MNTEKIKALLFELSLDPTNPELLIDLGMEAFFENHYVLAINCYSKLISLKVTLSESYQNRGVSYLNIEKYEEAIDDLTKSIEINSNSPTAYFYRGLCFLELSNNEACNDFKIAYNKGYKDAKVYMDRYCEYKITKYITMDDEGSIPLDSIVWNEDGVKFLNSKNRET